MALSCGGRRLSVTLDRERRDLQHLQADTSHATVEEIDADVTALPDPDFAVMQQLSEWLGQQAAAHAATLRSLRLAGPLLLASVLEPVATRAAEFRALEQVCLARGGKAWRADAAARALARLPALRRLQLRFSMDEDRPPQDLVALLLPAPAGAAPPPLRTLRHLALVYPTRSIVPPTGLLPEALALCSGLTSLKLKRIPLAREPRFLGALTQLRFLLYDPSTPADELYTMPPGLGLLTNLECLWLVTQTPLALPTSLSGLQGLHIIGRGYREEQRGAQAWGWLAPFSRLRGLRMQGVGLQALPAEMAGMGQLTRLDLMVNDLRELPPGPYLASLRCAHLGHNRFERFPSALLQATNLETLYLANQSMDVAPDGSCGHTRRMELTGADVEGLLALPRLRTVVMGNLQPVVALGGGHRNAAWLQRALAARGVRLTSEELAYPLQHKRVFDVGPLALGEAESGGGGGGDEHGVPPSPASSQSHIQL